MSTDWLHHWCAVSPGSSGKCKVKVNGTTLSTEKEEAGEWKPLRLDAEGCRISSKPIPWLQA